MRLVALVLVSALAATPAVAQSWGSHDRYVGGRSNAVPSSFDWRSQLDRPGDYRCDQFWDANRSDCDAGWRDQRYRASPQARGDYRALAGRDGAGYGYGYGHDYGQQGGDRYGHGPQRYGHPGYGHATSHRGYGSAYGHAQGSTTWNGVYGRPDHVYPGVGQGGYVGHGGSRADWCRATYRSYDPYSGYYRAYSGRLVFCG